MLTSLVNYSFLLDQWWSIIKLIQLNFKQVRAECGLWPKPFFCYLLSWMLTERPSFKKTTTDGHSVTMAKMSRLKWEIRFGSRMVEFEHLVQAFVITSLPVGGAKTVFLLSLESPSWIKTKETVSSVLRNLSRQSVVSQDHTSQDHFCSVINEFPVWNSKSVTPRWWD